MEAGVQYQLASSVTLHLGFRDRTSHWPLTLLFHPGSSSQDLPVSVPSAWLCPVLRIQTRVLMLTEKALYPLSQLSSLSFNHFEECRFVTFYVYSYIYSYFHLIKLKRCTITLSSFPYSLGNHNVIFVSVCLTALSILLRRTIQLLSSVTDSFCLVWGPLGHHILACVISSFLFSPWSYSVVLYVMAILCLILPLLPLPGRETETWEKIYK